MPSLVLIGPAVRPAIGNRQTNKQTDKRIAFYYVDKLNSRITITFTHQSTLHDNMQSLNTLKATQQKGAKSSTLLSHKVIP